MNIVIYTSLNQSSFDEFNISQLIKARPEHNYSIVVLKTKQHQISFINRIKRMLVSLRDGRNELQRDIVLLDKVISQKVSGFSLTDFPTYYVDALNDSATEDLIKGLNPDIIVQAGAGILKENIFSIARKGTLNVHHGLAPEVRGIKSTFWCLYYGLTDLIGVTCHLIDKNLDTGNIITQYKYNYQSGDTFLKIQEDLCINGAELLVKAIDILGTYSSLEFKESEIESFYFGSVNYINYNELKKRGFRSVKPNELSSLKTKLKAKRILIPKDFQVNTP